MGPRIGRGARGSELGRGTERARGGGRGRGSRSPPRRGQTDTLACNHCNFGRGPPVIFDRAIANFHSISLMLSRNPGHFFAGRATITRRVRGTRRVDTPGAAPSRCSVGDHTSLAIRLTTVIRGRAPATVSNKIRGSAVAFGLLFCFTNRRDLAVCQASRRGDGARSARSLSLRAEWRTPEEVGLPLAVPLRRSAKALSGAGDGSTVAEHGVCRESYENWGTRIRRIVVSEMGVRERFGRRVLLVNF